MLHSNLEMNYLHVFEHKQTRSRDCTSAHEAVTTCNQRQSKSTKKIVLISRRWKCRKTIKGIGNCKQIWKYRYHNIILQCRFWCLFCSFFVPYIFLVLFEWWKRKSAPKKKGEIEKQFFFYFLLNWIDKKLFTVQMCIKRTQIEGRMMMFLNMKWQKKEDQFIFGNQFFLFILYSPKANGFTCDLWVRLCSSSDNNSFRFNSICSKEIVQIFMRLPYVWPKWEFSVHIN